ncbi:S1 family peptidase [Actinosynnema sp. NPDC047251]|uniref:Trypsin-like protein n=1 Tax=Saccharothrix espanaensis (strain ATCC 51144 / DSM 44229 / JCM 9112 / NBRC 15066 / NRRL 15764) TaxID=1179773 RepID=K0JZK1_SACES|nr:S1 family peptidase [Saccharothrix espanaensis]CCH31521.1 Trypsin-like protein [Saccharothrix espanaensis DSM 44229]
MRKIVNGRRLAARSAITLVAGVLTAGITAAPAAGIEGYATEVAQSAIADMSTREGISPAAAAEILRTQDASARTLGQLSDRLGDRVAGGYLDANGKPVVNVLDAATAEQVRASGAEAKLVRHSSQALASAQSTLESVPAVTHTSVGLDPKTNQVVLSVSSAAKGGDLAALLRTARQLGDRVRVERVTGEMTLAILNGEAITGGGTRCSVGFNTNKGGQNYIVDAGHCTRAVSQWNVGPSQGASFPTNDYGLIRNTTGSAPGAVSLYNGSSQKISSHAPATVGQRIQKSGSTTRLTSGSVQRLNVTVNYSEGAVRELIQTNALANPGDSGGCLFAGSVGLGITSGKGSGTSYYQPVAEALTAYGVTLNP